MDELRAIDAAVQPHNTLLVVDAMTGQEAVNVAEAFNDAVGLDGVILTKIDGDARGGAALSVKEVVGKPILFAGTGEKLDEFEPFHPDRMASRILGMGDVLTLIEKVEATFEEDEKRKAEEIAAERHVHARGLPRADAAGEEMGPLQNVLGMLPGMPKEIRNAEIDDQRDRADRGDHPVDDARRAPQARRSSTAPAGCGSRRGSGTTTAEVNNLLKQFKQVQQMMKGMPRHGPQGQEGQEGQGPEASRSAAACRWRADRWRSPGGIPGLPSR